MSAAPKANPPIRSLLGPGPSPVHPRVLAALSLPVVGHLDPKFLEIMDQSMAMLREVFQTKNRLALPMSGTGSAGRTSITSANSGNANLRRRDISAPPRAGRRASATAAPG